MTNRDIVSKLQKQLNSQDVKIKEYKATIESSDKVHKVHIEKMEYNQKVEKGHLFREIEKQKKEIEKQKKEIDKLIKEVTKLKNQEPKVVKCDCPKQPTI